MPHRVFMDSHGVVWAVWEVEPSRAERRGIDPDSEEKQYQGPERRQFDDPTPRARLSADFAHGWLAFESRVEKRRLAPVPDGWELLSDAALEELLNEARSAGKPRRLIE
jgi:hypothetical protein